MIVVPSIIRFSVVWRTATPRRGPTRTREKKMRLLDSLVFIVFIVFYFGAGEQGEFGTESGTELPLPFFSFLSLYIVKDKKEKNNIYLLYLCYRKY